MDRDHDQLGPCGRPPRTDMPVMPRRQIQADPSRVPEARRDEDRIEFEDRFVKLLDELWLPVYRYVLRTGLCPEDAKDITQEAFLRLFKHLVAAISIVRFPTDSFYRTSMRPL